MMSLRVKLANYFGTRDRGWLLTLLVAACLVYLPFLGNPFVFDDVSFFASGTGMQYAQSGFHWELRWLPYATLGWTEMMFSNAVTHFFHLGNLLLHAANVIVLFYLLRQLLAAAAPDGTSASATLGAWFAALIFALHPVAVFAVGYVVQSSILMATLFALLAQYTYVRGLLTGQSRWLMLSVLAYFLAVFSKEHAVMMPAVLLAATILLRGSSIATMRQMILAWCSYAAIGLLIITSAKGVTGTPYEAMAVSMFEQQGVVESGAMLHLLSALTQAGLFFKYLFLWLVPNTAWMAVDMRVPFVHSLSDWRGWVGMVAFLSYGLFALRLLLRGKTAGLIGFALLFPWLQFVLEFSSIRVQEIFVLYRSYLWMPGLLLLIPLIVTRWPGRQTMIALSVVILLLVPLSINRLWVFADNYRLWDDAAKLMTSEVEAGADRIFFNRAQASVALQEWDKAIADYRRALVVSPNLVPVHNELGMAYIQSGNYREAQAQFDDSIRLKPDDGQAYYGKGLAMMGLRESRQATQLFEKACALKVRMGCMMAGWRKKD